MNPSHIRLLYVRELRSALRERAIVVNGILMPVFLYPVLLWVMFTGITFVQGLNEGFTSRVVVEGALPPAHAALLDSLVASKDILVLGRETDEGGGDAGVAADPLPIPADPAAALQAGEVDALVRFEGTASADATAAAPTSLPDNFRVHVRFDRSESRSRMARDRVEEMVSAHRSRWLEARGEELGLDDERRALFAVASENVSTEEELGAMILGLMLPLFLVIMVALGCFMPAVDTTAGERERSTWETLLTVAASRSSVIVAKYLYVATLGILAGLLNVVAMFLSIGAVLKPLLEGNEALSFSIPGLAFPVMAMGAVVLALFFAAGMMILASFARTFKDGQAMVQPVYWLVFIPMLLGNQTDLTLTPTIAAVPVANVTMMIRDALNGVFHWPLIALTVAVNLAVVALFLWVARRILVFEDFLLGSFDGSFWRFLKERIVGRNPPSRTEVRSHA
ncbi:MAG TPA: ABC transporter permease subunit [Longimicrobiales bacterium]|nr:ABC transporter permease subunit [Longimicrobiales bacterium]